jgi:putative DNA primase/helicase
MSSPAVVQSYRASLYSAGYRPLPVINGTKRASEKGWQHLSKMAPPPCVSSWPEPTALSTGIYCGEELIAVDIDVDDTTLAEQVYNVAASYLGSAPMRYRDGSARRLMIYRSSEPKRRFKTISAGDGRNVDFLTGDHYFVAEGLHPDGSIYAWNAALKDWPVASLPAVSAQQVESFRDTAAAILGARIVQTSTEPIASSFDLSHVPTDREIAYAQQALDSELARLRGLGPGSGRNNALNVAAHSVGTCVSYGLDLHAAARALLDAAISNGHVGKHGEAQTKKTIESGLKAGMVKPRTPLAAGDPTPVDLSRLTTGGGASTAPQAASKGISLTPMTDIRETPIVWLWPDYLPSGMLTLLSGAGGTGKSTLAFSLAAIVSAGGVFPDGTRCGHAGNVLIWSGEDSLDTTIKPRLSLANADPAKVFAIEGATDEQGERLPFDPSRDIEQLRNAAYGIGGVSLLIIDPIVSAIAGDMHKANDVRRSLQPIVRFAEETGCAVLGITHFAKNTAGRNPTDRVLGSQAFSALARMVLVAAKEEDSDRRIFTRSKSNISIDTGGFAYSIEALTLPSGVLATRIVWGEALEGNARDILASVEVSDGNTKPINMQQEAAKFLHAELKDGPVPARDLLAKAKKDFGLTERTLQRAKDKLGIVVTKSGFHGGWVWSYPFAFGLEK